MGGEEGLYESVGGGLQGKSGERGIPVPEVKSDGKSDCPCRSVSKQPSAAVIWANISRDYGRRASWERRQGWPGPSPLQQRAAYHH